MVKETTDDPRLSREELREIHEIARVLAKLYVISLKKGFKNEAIAMTFASVFLGEFCQLMDDETINLVSPQIGVNHFSETKSGDKMTYNVCLKLSSSFMKAVTDFLKKKRA